MSGRRPAANPRSRGGGRGGGQGGGRGSGQPSEHRGGQGRGFQPSRGGEGGRRGYEGRGERGGGRGDRGGRARGVVQVFQTPNRQVPTPDSQITKLESSLVHLEQQRGTPDISKLSLSERLPQRPGYGTRGVPVVLWTNYFRLIPQPNSKLYRYHIEVSPDASGRQRHQVIRLLLNTGPLAPIASSIASDFQSTLICTRELSSTERDVAVAYVEPESTPEEGDTTSQKHYRVKLSPTGSFLVADLINYLTGTSATDAFSDEHAVTQALNIVLGHHPKVMPVDKRVSTRSNVHFIVDGLNNRETFDLAGGLQAWRGYFTSVRAATGRLLVNVQVKHSAMYKACRLDELMTEFLRENNNDKAKLQIFLKKVRIRRLHLRSKSKPIAIEGLASPADGRGSQNPPRIAHFGSDSNGIEFFMGDNPPKPKSGQPLQSNQYIKVSQFFSRVYGIMPKSGLPAVKTGRAENPGYLPPEACEVLPAQTVRAKLSPSQTAQMIRFAVRRPFQNAQSITTSGLADVGLNNSNPILNAFGLEIQSQMLTVEGRILTPPTLTFASQKTAHASSGGWNMGSLTFSKGVTLTKWSVLWLRARNHRDPWDGDPQLLTATLQQFHGVLSSSGVRAEPPQLPGVTINVGGNNDKLALQDGFKQVMSRGRQEKLFLVLMPERSDPLYHAIKQCGDIEFGVHTVCVVASKFAKDRNQQYFANVSLKFNLKLGGTNQSLAPRTLNFIETGNTMLVGIDVTHPSPGSESSAPSIAAMVASIDKSLSQFPGILSSQESRKEMVTDLSSMLKTRLALWRKHNGNKLPENIIVYRDGVSEGQYGLVLQNELPLLREACEQTYPGTGKGKSQGKAKQPAISIIIAGKRHNTRFYPTTTDSDKIDERSMNPKNGTVVDRGITESHYWDFFLQAHTAIQGTARPCHYFVVHDEIFAGMQLPPGFQHVGDVLENITHNICYMFGRATRAVSLCPPAYYADLLCERARCYLSHLFSPVASQAGSVSEASGLQDNALVSVRVHDNLKDTMFYI